MPRRRAPQVLLFGTIGMQVMRQCLRVDFVIMVAFARGLMESGKVGQENFKSSRELTLRRLWAA